jgi:hypothetical protein
MTSKRLTGFWKTSQRHESSRVANVRVRVGIQLKWDDSGRVPEGTVIFWKFGESWTWAEFFQREQETYEWHMQAVPRTIYTIADMQRNNRMPGIEALSSFVHHIKHRPPNRGKVIVVDAGRTIKLLEPIIRRLVPDLSADYILVDSLDEAYELVLAELEQQETDTDT